MSSKVTLGGERLGSGKKMDVEMHGYGRSTHDKSYVWRNTQAPGTLVPFMLDVATPGDTWDIRFRADVMTHPTVGPLFGSYKMQLDVFEIPMRLYIAELHNNELYIGYDMSKIKMPIIELVSNNPQTAPDIDTAQISPSAILAYLGIRGVGTNVSGTTRTRDFNAIPLISYWDIYKNYYANKQEERGAVIHTPRLNMPVINGMYLETDPGGTITTIPEEPAEVGNVAENNGIMQIGIDYVPGTPVDISQILVKISVPLDSPQWVQLSTIVNIVPTEDVPGSLKFLIQRPAGIISFIIYSWRLAGGNEQIVTAPEVTTFPLTFIDECRKAILRHDGATGPWVLNDLDRAPYNLILGNSAGVQNMLQTQEGLGVKTYQSDMLNNWLNSARISGPNGINEITAIDVSGGLLFMDALLLQKKAYDFLNRVSVTGGSYQDWQRASWDHDRFGAPEIPAYRGGMIQEVVFQEVVSNSASSAEGVEQPLGTLAGKGVLARERKGGHVHIETHEPGYIMGIVSLTPRIDYSQGNEWHVTELMTMNDLHKPAFDEIGFQELRTEQMAWWDTGWDNTSGLWVQHSAGKQPAWLNYMTNVNKTYGNFAIKTNEMFMTLNRRYEPTMQPRIADVTTYIHPAKFNFIFAQTSLDAMNFWIQIGVDITVRRKMSAKIMPSL